MNKYFKFSYLTSILEVLLPSINSKTSLWDIQELLENSEYSINRFFKLWKKEVIPWLATIPVYESAVNPFINGLDGRTFVVDKNITTSHPYFYSSVKGRPKTLFEINEEMFLTLKSIRTSLLNLSSSIHKIQTKVSTNRFSLLTDSPNAYFKGQYLKVNAAENALEPTSSLTVDQSFLALVDTPYTYSGKAGYLLSVKNDRTGIEFKNRIKYQNWKHEIQSGTSNPSYILQDDGPGVNNYKMLEFTRHPNGTNYTFTGSSVGDGAETRLLLTDYYGDVHNPHNEKVELLAGGVESSPLESPTLYLNDVNRSFHLVYSATRGTHFIIGKGY